MCMFYACYSCLAMQLLEGMPCDTFATNHTINILDKIQDQALVNKEKEICTRIALNSGMATSENNEKSLSNFQNLLKAKINVIFFLKIST